VIVDESYLPFVDGWEQKSVMKSDLPNAFILHSLSKIYAIPGLRIGLLIFPEKFRKMIIRTLQPWSVSAPAQTAARYIMENKEKVGQFIKKSQRFIKIEKKKFLKQFETARGIRFFSSQTGYMLARLSGRHSADRLVDYLSNRKILIRNCKNFKGLSDQYVRISIKNSKANKTCAENIRFFLDHINGTGRDTK
jgi:threonine-phosphate decarboxylase